MRRCSLPESVLQLLTIFMALGTMLTSDTGVHFPKNFQSTVRQLVKRLFRVYAHIYCHHYHVIVALGLDPHMNTSFKHYVLFIKEFNLESGRDFYGPLSDMVDTILRTDS